MTMTAMTWEDYAALPTDPRQEYIDGSLVVNPSPTFDHQTAGRRLANLIESALATARVVTEWAWKPADDEFIPDVLVVPVVESRVRFTGTPLLAVEILSTDRSADLVVKAEKYARAGLPRFWVLDLVDTSLSAFALGDDGAYHRMARAVGDETVELDTGDGTVTVAPAALVR